MTDRESLSGLVQSRHRKRLSHNIAFAEIDLAHRCLFHEIISEGQISARGAIAVQDILILIHIHQQLTGIKPGRPVIALIAAAGRLVFHVRVHRPWPDHGTLLVCICPGRCSAARTGTHIM